MLRWLCRSSTVLSLALAAGCAGAPSPGCGPLLGLAGQVLDCVPTVRRAILPDVSALAAEVPESIAAPTDYCLLTESEAQCLAVRGSTLAAMLEAESAAVATRRHGVHEATSSDLTRSILSRLAWHERDRSAAAVLEAFLRLAEAEGGHDNLLARLAVTDKILSDIENIQRQGMMPPLRYSEVQAQRLELLHREAELVLARHELHDQLVELLDITLPETKRLWPEADLVVTPELPSETAAVQRALEQRADLAALRLAFHADDRARLAAAQLLLPAVHPGLGLASAAGWLTKMRGAAAADEAAVRTRQLSELLAEREYAVAREVREAHLRVATRLEQIVLRRDRLELTRRQLESARQQRELQPASLLAEREAQLAVLAAEQDLLHDVIEWKIAIVQFKQAQGQLARECH